MVTIEDLNVELTRPIKDLASWDYPFSDILETYYTLFRETSNKGFNNAGLVLQNSTAVFVHRIDGLWNRTAVIRNIFVNYEKENEKKKLSRKRDRNFNVSIENFETINFAQEVDKNIDIKKSNVTQESVKSKTRCFTQLEKSIAHHIPIDIYDVNGEIIGKKYDFRCNQNISINGALVDEFAPEDFDCNNDDTQEKSTSAGSQHSHVTESVEHSSNTHDSSDRNISSDEESERNDSAESSEVARSPDSSKNLSSSADSISDTPHGSTTDNLHDQSFTDALNESQVTSLSDTNLSSNTADNSTLSNNNTDAQDKNVHDDDGQLDSTIKSTNSQERTVSMNNSTLSGDADKNAKLSENCSQTTNKFQADESACLKYIRERNTIMPLQYDYVMDAASNFLGFRSNMESCDDTLCDDVTHHMDTSCDDVIHYMDTSFDNTICESVKTPTKDEKVVEPCTPADCKLTPNSSNSTCKSRSRRKNSPRTPKRGRISKKLVKKRSVVRNLLNKLQKESSECFSKVPASPKTDRLSTFQQDLKTCMKYMQEHDPLQYEHMMNAASDLLGFRLRVVEECDSMRDDKSDNMMSPTDFDDDRGPCSPASSRNEEIFSDTWLRSDSPEFLPKDIEKWHELLQPKLQEAERRSKFSLRNYSSRMVECLRASTQCQVDFDDAVPKDDASEVARYFLASLDLASRQKVNLIRNMDHSLQIALYEEDVQYPSNDEEDSHD